MICVVHDFLDAWLFMYVLFVFFCRGYVGIHSSGFRDFLLNFTEASKVDYAIYAIASLIEERNKKFKFLIFSASKIFLKTVSLTVLWF